MLCMLVGIIDFRFPNIAFTSIVTIQWNFCMNKESYNRSYGPHTREHALKETALIKLHNETEATQKNCGYFSKMLWTIYLFLGTSCKVRRLSKVVYAYQ